MSASNHFGRNPHQQPTLLQPNIPLPMMIPQHQQLPLGPTTPSIFCGHFGMSNSTDQATCIPGKELILTKPSKLEGIHIVPFGVSPPGIQLQGNTKPAMTVRPFIFRMYVRNVVDSQIIPVFSLTIHGGVQWMAIPPPFNTMEVDMIALEGDFETISLIVSGVESSSTGLKAGDSAGVEDEDEGEEEEDLLDGEEEPLDKADNYLYKVQSAALVSESAAHSALNAKMRKLRLKCENKSDVVARTEGALPSTWFADSRVSINSVAALVGEIFSFAESLDSAGQEGSAVGKEEVQSKILLLSRLSEHLSACWSDQEGSGEASDKMITDDAVVADGGKDSVGSVVGPEAANLLCSIVVNGFDQFRFDTFLTTSAEDTDEAAAVNEEQRLELFDQYGTALFTCCKAILANAFFATEFLDCGGVAVFSSLLQQHQHCPLPAHLFLQLLECVSVAVQHFDLAVKFNEPVDDQEYTDEHGNPYIQQEISPYQALLYVTAGLKEDAEATVLCGKALRWCALAESLHQLTLFSYSVLNDVAKIAEALAASHSSVNNNAVSSAGEEEQGGEAGAVSSAVLHPCCFLLEELYGSVATKVNSVLTAMEVVTAEKSGFDPALLLVLSKSKIFISILALSGLVQVARDLSTSVDWSAPSSTQLHDYSAALYVLLLSVLQRLSLTPGFEALLSMHCEETQLLFNFLVPHSNLASVVPLSELQSVAGGATADYDLLLQSFGWSWWLSAHVFTLCGDVASHSALAEPVTLSATQLEVVSGLTKDLCELSTHHVSREVVVRVVARSPLLDTLMEFANKLLRQHKSGELADENKKILSNLLRIVMFVGTSKDNAALDAVRSHSGELSSLVQLADSESDDILSDSLLSETVARHTTLLKKALLCLDAVKSKSVSDHKALFESFSLIHVTDAAFAAQFVQTTLQLSSEKLSDDSVKLMLTPSADLLAKVSGFLLTLRNNRAMLSGENEDGDLDESDSAVEAPSSDNILESQPSAKKTLQYCANILSLLQAVLSAVHSALQSADAPVLEVAAEDKLLVAVVETYCVIHSVANAASSSELGAQVRSTTAWCVSVLQLYCPNSSQFRGADHSCLVAYLARQSFASLGKFDALISLLDALLPSRFAASGIYQDPEEGETEESAGRVVSPSENFENQDVVGDLAAGEIDFDIIIRKQKAAEARLVPQWVSFASRSLVVVKASKTEKTFHVLSRKPLSGKKKDDAKEAKDEKNGGSSSVPSSAKVEDDLYTALRAKKFSVSTLVLAGMMSSAKSIQARALSVALKYMALAQSFALAVCGAVVRTVTSCYAIHLAPATEDVDEAEQSNQAKLLHRVLLFVNLLAHEDTACFLLVQSGVLAPLVSTLQSANPDVVMAALQAITTAHRVLNRIAAHSALFLDSEGSKEDSVESLFASRHTLSHGISLILETLGVLVAEQLPKLILRFSNSLALLQQGPLALQHFSTQHNKLFLSGISRIGEGITIEFLAVKLWIAFEESFKVLDSAAVEPKKEKTAERKATVDPRRHKIRVSIEAAPEEEPEDPESAKEAREKERLNCESHVQFERASWALRAVVDYCLKAYTGGWIELTTLARAMRVSHADPKKVTRRIQRAYTMWVMGLSTAGKSEDDGLYWRDNHCTISSAEFLHTVSDNAAFESRHAVISVALKSLVDSMNVLSVFLVAKEKTYGGAPRESADLTNDELVTIKSLDLSAPFSELESARPAFQKELLDSWFAKRNYSSRVGHRCAVRSSDVVQADFNRDTAKFIELDTTECFPLKFELSGPAAGLFEVRKRQALSRKQSKRKKSRFAATEPVALGASQLSVTAPGLFPAGLAPVLSFGVPPADSASQFSYPQKPYFPQPVGGQGPPRGAPAGHPAGPGSFNPYAPPPFAANGMPPRPLMPTMPPQPLMSGTVTQPPHQGGPLPFRPPMNGLPPRGPPPGTLPGSAAPGAPFNPYAPQQHGSQPPQQPFSRYMGPPGGSGGPYNQQPPPRGMPPQAGAPGDAHQPPVNPFGAYSGQRVQQPN